MGWKAFRVGCAAAAMAFSVTATEARSDAPAEVDARDFSVEFTGCVESIGVTLALTENVQPLVPPPFLLVDDVVNPIVVRSARCAGIAVAGHPSEPGSVVQVGAIIVPPDDTGDINNYTLWYFTTSAHLAAHLRDAGVEVRHVETIVYESPAGDGPLPFHVSVEANGRSVLSLDGSVVPSVGPPISFQANWWRGAGASVVKMATVVPLLDLGDADLRLACDPGGALARLLGAARAEFPILQQFNLFDAAQMEVAVTP